MLIKKVLYPSDIIIGTLQFSLNANQLCLPDPLIHLYAENNRHLADEADYEKNEQEFDAFIECLHTDEDMPDNQGEQED